MWHFQSSTFYHNPNLDFFIWGAFPDNRARGHDCTFLRNTTTPTIVPEGTIVLFFAKLPSVKEIYSLPNYGYSGQYIHSVVNSNVLFFRQAPMTNMSKSNVAMAVKKAVERESGKHCLAKKYR